MKKKIIYTILYLLFSAKIFSNPIFVPGVFISEFMFDKNNNWIMELSFHNGYNYKNMKIDSIRIYSKSGYSKVRLENLKDGIPFVVLTTDSLTKPLKIDKTGDKLIVRYFLKELMPPGAAIDSLMFGNYPGSLINQINPGYSLRRIGYWPSKFCKDITPSIGIDSFSDTTGYYAILTGYIYDGFHKAISNDHCVLDELLYTDNEGRYSTKIYARKLVLKYLGFRGPEDTAIQTLEIDAEPDSIYNKDIFLLGGCAIENKNITDTNNELQLINYPNPFNSRTNFFLKIPSELQGKEGYINIYNSNGQKVNEIKVSGNSTINWGGKDKEGRTLASGSYYYQLVFNNRVLKNGSMILLK